MKNKLIFFSLVLSLLLILFGFRRGIIPGGPIEMFQVAADTTGFSPNRAEGWDILSSYLNQISSDSVDFQLILTQAATMGGNQSKLIGKIINPAFMPRQTQLITYALLSETSWQIKIKPDGECYMVEVNGLGAKKSNLSGSPEVLPIKVRYKNK